MADAGKGFVNLLKVERVEPLIHDSNSTNLVMDGGNRCYTVEGTAAEWSGRVEAAHATIYGVEGTELVVHSGLKQNPEPAQSHGLGPSSQMMWLASHCKAIGMTRRSDSRLPEHDIALFTTELKEKIDVLRKALEPFAKFNSSSNAFMAALRASDVDRARQALTLTEP
jgi:hypothetical protein